MSQQTRSGAAYSTNATTVAGTDSSEGRNPKRQRSDSPKLRPKPQAITERRSSPRLKANQSPTGSGQLTKRSTQRLKRQKRPPEPVPTTTSSSVNQASELTQAEAQIQFQAHLLLSRNEATVAESRRRALREQQAAQSPSLTEHEPDLNSTEVRHFEVNAQGGLTFILFDTHEAWLLEEIEANENNGPLQMIAGKAYRVVKV